MTAGLVGRWVEYADVAGHFRRVHDVTLTHSDFNQLVEFGLLEKRQGPHRWECFVYDQSSFDKVVELMVQVDAVERLEEPSSWGKRTLPHIVLPASAVTTISFDDDEDE